MTFLDPRVVQFAVEAGLHVQEGDDVVEVASSDTSDVIREADGTFRVEMVDHVTSARAHRHDVGGRMKAAELPPTLRSLLSDPGAGAWPTHDGAGLEIGDSETSFVVRRVGERHAVEEVQRGRVKRVVLRTTDEQALVRYLALVLAVWWRDAARLPSLPLTADTEPPEGTSIARTGPRRYTLRWVRDGLERQADDMIEYQAIELAHTLAFPLEVVVAALHDPVGAPVFSGPTGRGHPRPPRARGTSDDESTVVR